MVFQTVSKSPATIVRGLDCLLEIVVLALVCLSPWAFGAVHPLFESMLFSGIALVAALWSARLLIEWRFPLRHSAFAWCLVGLLALGLWQLLPWSHSLLSLMSPATAQLSERLLPKQPELLADGQPAGSVAMPAGQTISLFPAATRQVLIRLLAVLCLFGAVLNTYASSRSFGRLCAVALINGTALAYFGVAQFLSAEHRVLYWTYESQGTAFGPFVNRNHFACYINICVGLSLGLLLSWQASDGGRALDEWRKLLQMFKDSKRLAAVLGVVTMVASLLLCVSRGGVASMLLGGLACLAFKVSQSRRLRGFDIFLLAAVLTAALLYWLGFNLLESRLATLWHSQALRTEGRLQVWKDTLFAVLDFPIWGTGYGTFAQIEPLYRSRAYDTDMLWSYAHNDYQQALVEGGALRLLLTLLAIGLLYRELYRAFAHHAGRPVGGLVLGAVWALTAVFTHAFVENGLQIPAIACLMTVLSAQVFRLRFHRTRHASSARTSRQFPPSISNGAPILAAACLVLAGMFLHLEGRRADVAERFRLTALRAEKQGQFPAQIVALEAALQVAPEDAALQAELASAHFRLTELSPMGLPLSPADPHLLASQRHYLHARDLCLLLPQPQVWLAANAESLARGDGAETYLERARIIRPFDPQIWYVRGARSLARGDLPEALRNWRRSLELSPQLLNQILERLQQLDQPPGPEMLLEQLLPRDPQQVYQAAELLYPDSEDAARLMLLHRASELLQGRPFSLGEYRLETVLRKDLQ